MVVVYRLQTSVAVLLSSLIMINVGVACVDNMIVLSVAISDCLCVLYSIILFAFGAFVKPMLVLVCCTH